MTKRILFAVILLVFAAPMIQNSLGIVESGKLYGDFRLAEDVEFSFKEWWTGEYQEKKSKYHNDNFGFHNDFVRINNQVHYSLFDKIHAHSIVLGKDHYLFSEYGIGQFCGTNRTNDTFLQERLGKLKDIQDTLERLGKVLLFVQAPAKSRYYPEYFPESLSCEDTDQSDYHRFVTLSDSLHINHLNLNGWFVSLKRQTKYPLFLKQGYHWSKYGTILAADSLVECLTRQLNQKLPDLVITSVRINHDISEQDRDISTSLNLIFPFVEESEGLPDYHFEEDSTSKKPKVIFLGDSFLWSFSYANIFEGISKDWEFWYYFQDVWNRKSTAGEEEMKHMKDYDWRKSLLEADALVMVYSETNLYRVGSGFIEEAFEHFYGKDVSTVHR